MSKDQRAEAQAPGKRGVRLAVADRHGLTTCRIASKLARPANRRDVFVTAMEEGPLRAAQGALPAEVIERVPLAMSQLIGLGFARYVLEAPSIVSMTPEELVEAITPALESILG